jgi:GTP-binding protein
MPSRPSLQTSGKKPRVVGSHEKPIVAIVGRPNVGKSALFNRLVGSRVALVEDLPGTTRDRLYGDVEWRGKEFRVVDTGGLEPAAQASYPALVREQVERAVEESQAILFVVDAKEGMTAGDLEVADVLRRAAKPVLLLANKAESDARREEAVQFFELGLGEALPVSAHHGAGVADVLDLAADMLPPAVAGEAVEALRTAIVGRPNVGKSMLLNAILGEERVVVSEMPGTTRDSIDTAFEYDGHHLILVDTAGVRRRGHIQRGLEKHAVLRARNAMERCDVALLVIDADEGFTAQDAHIAGYAIDALRGLVLAVNKWDLMDEGKAARRQFEVAVRQRLRFAPWIPLCFVSAKERTGLGPMLELTLAVGEERQRRIATAELNNVIGRATAAHSPPSVHGRRPKILYVTQAATAPPTFVFFTGGPSRFHFSYRRYLENSLREAFGFAGTPLKLVFRGREKR